MFSTKLRSTLVVISGGAAFYGVMKICHENEVEAKANPAWKSKTCAGDILHANANVVPNRFTASCTAKARTAGGKVAPANMMLYWGSGSPPCWRVMITLEEKGLSGYRNKLLSMSNKEHKSDEVLALNHRGQLPTFKHGSVVLNESLAACDFIATTYADQGTDLLPIDSREYAAMLQLKYEALVFNKKGLEDIFTLGKIKNHCHEGILKHRKEGFLGELKYWDELLAKGGKRYLTGKQFTMADVVMYPSLALMVRLGLELEPRFPNLARYYKVVSDRPSVKATWPPHWKGSPRGDLLKDV